MDRPADASDGGAVWVCGAPTDGVAAGLVARLERLGIPVSTSPDGAERAVVVLSPGLAGGAPTTLGEWMRDRGSRTTVLVLAEGRAEWDDVEDRFSSVSDAVPPSLRGTFRTRPIVLDLREADDAKLDRVARRLAGAVSSLPATAAAVPGRSRVAPAPPPGSPAGAPEPAGPRATDAPQAEPPGRSARRLGPLLGVAVGVAIAVAALATFTLGSESSSDGPQATEPSTSPTRPPSSSVVLPTLSRPSTTTPPTTTVTGTATSSDDDSLAEVLVVALSVALAISLLAHVLRSRRRPPRPPAPEPPPVDKLAAGIQVFISHDTDADGRVAERLAGRLVDRRLQVWRAPDSIRPGEAFAAAIERGLLTSRAALVLLSPAALASGWVRREIQWIVDLEIDGKLYVVPVNVEPCEPPLLLSAYQRVELDDFDRAAEELYRRFVAEAEGSTPAG